MGFGGGRSERAFVDVHVFNPVAPSNTISSLSTCYKKHENIKKRLYRQCTVSEKLNMPHQFTPVPMVMSVTGDLAMKLPFLQISGLLVGSQVGR